MSSAVIYRGVMPIAKVNGSTSYHIEDLNDYSDINWCRNRKPTDCEA
jgi:hypothetical protein